MGAGWITSVPFDFKKALITVSGFVAMDQDWIYTQFRND
jgi:hypothetical protein